MNADDTYIIPKTASTLTGGGHSGGLHSDMTIIRQLPRGKNKGADLKNLPYYIEQCLSRKQSTGRSQKTYGN